MDICSSHFTNVFRILEKYFVKEFDESMKDKILEELLEESCPTEFYLRNLRAFPMLVGKPYDQILEYDSGFNIYFIKEQEKRVNMMKTLVSKGCKERHDREKQVWDKWLTNYIQLKPKIN